MEERITLKFREPHLYWGNDGLHVVDSLAYSYNITIPVVDGVAYAPVTDSRHYALLAALDDTPEEIAKKPGVTLYYAELDKDGNEINRNKVWK